MSYGIPPSYSQQQYGYPQGGGGYGGQLPQQSFGNPQGGAPFDMYGPGPGMGAPGGQPSRGSVSQHPSGGFTASNPNLNSGIGSWGDMFSLKNILIAAGTLLTGGFIWNYMHKKDEEENTTNNTTEEKPATEEASSSKDHASPLPKPSETKPATETT